MTWRLNAASKKVITNKETRNMLQEAAEKRNFFYG